MPRIIAYRVQNLRAFEDSSWIAIRPLTIVVGRNASGKSTLLRTLPLMRQSVETKTSSPVLWFGDLVDFGTAESALCRSAEDPEIRFGFRAVVERPRVSMFYRRRRAAASPDEVECDVTIGISSNPQGSFCSSVRFEILGHTVSISGNGDREITSFNVNGLDVLGLVGSKGGSRNWFFVLGGIVPSLFMVRLDAGKTAAQIDPSVRNAYWNAIEGLLDNRVALKTKESIRSRACEIPLENEVSFVRHLKSLSKLKTFQERLSRRLLSRRWVARLHSLHVAMLTESVLEGLDGVLSPWARSVVYIAPFRAFARRYYRLQDLRVDQIDPDGANLAMFLNSLSESAKLDLNEFVESQFGIGISTRRDGGHVVMEVTQKANSGDESTDNLIDTGFGLTQVLPVLTQVWAASVSRVGPAGSPSRWNPKDQPRTLTIEQPELHLHPAHQSNVGAVFAEAIRRMRDEKRMRAQYVVETHSHYLINAVGEAIRDGVIVPDDVVIYRVESQESGEVSVVEKSTFDEDGVLDNWPFGFFAG